MGKWADRAAALASASSDASARASDPSRLDGLPDHVRAGLNKLKPASPPRLKRPDDWSIVVADALRIASDGWAGRAFALGWAPIELFGIGQDYEGLAVWLDGRELRLLDKQTAIAARGNERRIFHRSSHVTAEWLWEWGR